MKKKMHMLRQLSHVPDQENDWTLCLAHPGLENRTTADMEVTCKKCLAVLTARAGEERAWQKRKAEA